MSDFHVFRIFFFISGPFRWAHWTRRIRIFAWACSNKNFDCIELFCLWNWFDVNVITTFRLFSFCPVFHQKWKWIGNENLSSSLSLDMSRLKICFRFEFRLWPREHPKNFSSISIMTTRGFGWSTIISAWSNTNSSFITSSTPQNIGEIILPNFEPFRSRVRRSLVCFNDTRGNC